MSSEKLVVACKYINERFKEYFVQTTHAEIKAQIDILIADEAKARAVYVGTLENLNKWTDEELNTHYELKNQDWNNFCNDAVLFYCARFVLMKQEIPITVFE
jgi:hypothetical protein